MPLKELFAEECIAIHHDTEGGWLHVDWRGYQTVGTVQAGCERILELMVEHRTGRVLNDNTHVVGIWNGASEWVAVDWFPRMTAAGLTCFAWVYSPSRFSQVSTDETLERMDSEAVGVKVFDDVDDARAWLRSCP